MESSLNIGEVKTPVDILNLKTSLRKAVDNNGIYSYIYFVLPDDAIYTGTDKIGRIYVDFIGTIIEVQASVKTAPTGASIIVDLNLNGTTIWTTQGNRVAIVAGAYTGVQTTPDVITLAVGDYFTIDLDQVGSTVSGAKLVVRLKIERAQS